MKNSSVQCSLSIGAVIYIKELSPLWIQQAQISGINRLGLHPEGGMHAAESLTEAVKIVQSENHRNAIKQLHYCNIEVDYEMHALSYMLPRGLFDLHPNWFRADENNNRTNDFNMCASNSEALEHIRTRAEFLTRLFPSDNHKYHFWIDDVTEKECHCEKCRELSSADQALIIYNAIADGVCRADTLGKQGYLAYRGTLDLPKQITPAKNIFLEFAPIARDLTKSITDSGCAKNRHEIANLSNLLKFFGTDDARVLEYWLDNSLLSGWKHPIKKYQMHPDIIARDAAFYQGIGIMDIASFACFLGDEYYESFRELPDLRKFTGSITHG